MKLQTLKKAMALALCLALVSNEAFARHNRRTRRAPVRTAQETRALNCLAAVAAGEAGGHGERAQINTMKTVLNRYRLGYGSSICGIVYARSQFAPRPGRVTPRIRQLAAMMLSKSADQIATAATHFHSYRGAYDRRAPWARRMAYLGFDGAHHLFRLSGTPNARLAAVNQQRLNQGISDGTSPTIMASAQDITDEGLFTLTSI
ncbi:MAG: cell wall hydrolase [Bdellovibrionales bacterium]|nr:cell wall hydrolase [Bdellovibrionales bacterium]